MKRFRKGDDDRPPGRNRDQDAARELEEAIGRGAPPGWGEPGYQVPEPVPSWQQGPQQWDTRPGAEPWATDPGTEPGGHYGADEDDDGYGDEGTDGDEDGYEGADGYRGVDPARDAGQAEAPAPYRYQPEGRRAWETGGYDYPDARAEEPEVTEFAVKQWAQAVGADRPEEAILRVDKDEITSARDRALKAFLDRRDAMRSQHAAERSVPGQAGVAPAGPRVPWADVIPQMRPRRPADQVAIVMPEAAPASEPVAAPAAPTKPARRRAPAAKKPARSRKAPAGSKKAPPAAKKTAPAAKKAAPAAKKTAPAAKKTAPAAKKTAPAAKKTAPAAKKTAPAAKKTAARKAPAARKPPASKRI